MHFEDFSYLFIEKMLKEKHDYKRENLFDDYDDLIINLPYFSREINAAAQTYISEHLLSLSILFGEKCYNEKDGIFVLVSEDTELLKELLQKITSAVIANDPYICSGGNTYKIKPFYGGKIHKVKSFEYYYQNQRYLYLTDSQILLLYFRHIFVNELEQLVKNYMEREETILK